MATNPFTSPGPAPSPLGAVAPRLPARRRKSAGQSLVEFTLTIPMALLMVLFGVDFGRVFLGWVALNQATREAANYAAMNPTAWTLPYNLAAQDEYKRLVTAETAGINCKLVTPIPAPVFPSGTSIGAPARVTLECDFNLITPFIGLITGDPIEVNASSAFPVRSGYIEDIPVETALPTTTPAPSATAAPTSSPAPSTSPDPSASPAGSAAPTATPGPTATPAPCNVVSLLNTLTNKAQTKWFQAGFTGQVIFSPLVPPNYRIAWQSLTVGTAVACSSNITVRSSAP